MTANLTAMGWAATVALGVSFILVLAVAALARRPRPQAGDDVIARFIAALELELADLDKRIQGDLGG